MGEIGKRGKIVVKTVLLMALALLFIMAARSFAATISCSYQETCGGNVSLLFVKNDTSGYQNAHAQLASNGSYPFSLCCNSSIGIDTTCPNDATVLNLSSGTNAHVQAGNTSAHAYGNGVCAGTTNGTIKITYMSTCPAGYTAIASISNDTNAHIADSNEYSLKVCMRITSKPSPKFVSLTDSDNATFSISRNYTFVNITVSNDTILDTVMINWNGTNVTIDDPSLVLSLDFNNNTQDKSRYGHHGRPMGAVNCSTSVQGKFQTACKIANSGTFINITDSDMLDIDKDTNFTVTAWIWTNDGSPAADGFDAIIEKNIYGGVSTGWGVGFSNLGQLRLVLGDGSTQDDFSDNNVLNDGKWHFVGITLNGTAITFYVDGGASRTATRTAGNTSNIHAIGIGGRARDGGAFFLNGQIDELRVWRRTLSGRELNASYKAELGKHNQTNSYYANFTDITEGTYSYSAYSNDTDGNENSTPMRTFTLDYTPPSPLFVSPTDPDNTTLGLRRNYTYINMTISEANLDTLILNWNGTNITINDPNLVLAMNFNNNTEVMSRYKYTIVNNSGANCSTLITGKFGTACSFNGQTSNIMINDSASVLDIQKNLTITAWVYANGISTNSTRQAIFHKGGNSGLADAGGYSLLLRHTNLTLDFVKLNAAEIESSVTVTPNQWQYVALTVGGNNVSYYINGVLGDSRAEGSAINSASSMNAYIGAYWSTSPTLIQYFNGSIDELKVWNRTLSPAEISASYRAEIGKFNGTNMYYANFTDLGEGNYTYFAWANDTVAQSNSSVMRTLVVDYTNPTVSYASTSDPDNLTIGTKRNYTYINVSVSDASVINSVIINWNGTNVTVDDPTLLLALDFDNNTIDRSRYRVTVTQNNTNCSSTVPGKYGAACNFSSIRRSNMTTNLNLSTNASPSSTWMAWVYPINFNAAKRQAILSIDAGGFGRTVLIEQNTENFAIFSGALSVNTGAAVSLNEWQHIVVIFNSTSLQFYKNGIKYPLPQVPVSPASTVFLEIGGNRGYGEYFNGSIDEVRIWNRSMSWTEINASYKSSIGKYNGTTSYYANFTDLREGNYTYFIWANDTVGNQQSTPLRTTSVDLTIPAIGFVEPTHSDNTTIGLARNYTFINVTVNEAKVHSVVLNWNGTNQTLASNGTSAFGNFYSINMSDLAEGNYTYFIYSNDTAANENSTPIRTLIVDYTVPGLTFVPPSDSDNTTATKKRNYTFINVTISESNIHTVIVNWNGTNQTLASNGSSTAGPFYSINMSDLGGGNYTYFVWANDTAGNQNSTANRVLIVDLIGIRITQNSPVPDPYTDRVNLSVNFTITNSLGYATNCTLDINTSGEIMIANASAFNIISGTRLNLTTSNLNTEGSYKYRINCSDRNDNNQTTDNRTFNLDTTNPIITIGNPAANTVTYGSDANLSLYLTAEDTNLFACEVNVTYSNGTEVFYNLTRNITGSMFIQNSTVNLSANANYTVNWTCTDDHTAKQIPDWANNVDIQTRSMMFNTGNNEIAITVDKVPDAGRFANFGVDKEQDRYSFRFRDNSPGTKTYAFIVESPGTIDYRGDRNFPAHFVITKNGSVRGEWVDFRLEGSRKGWDTNYTVTKLNPHKYEVTVNSTLNNMVFRSLGGLNEMSAFGHYYLDNTTPLINYIDPTPANKSTLSRTDILINISYTETNNNSFVINWNGTNYSQDSINATTTYFYHNFTSLNDGNYTYYAWIRDLSGNTNATPQRMMTIDTTLPSISSINASPVDWTLMSSSSRSITFSFVASDYNPDMCTVMHNASGTMQLNLSRQFVTGANTTIGPVNFSSDGSYNFTIYCNDTAGNNVIYSRNYTLLIDTATPAVALVSPANSTTFFTRTIGFQYNASDTNNASCELWTNMTGSWIINTTRQFNSGISDNFTIPLATKKSYLWNVRCNDSAWNYGTNLTNYTLHISAVWPVINFADPTDADNSTWKQSRNNAFVNISIQGNGTGIHTVILNWNGTNQTLVQNGTGFYSVNLTGINEGNYTFFARVNDSDGEENSTNLRHIIFDFTAPAFTYIPLTDEDNATVGLNRNYAYINLSTTEPYIHTVILNFNGTNQTLTRNGSNIYSINKTGLAEGNYTYFVWANDTAGNEGSSSLRRISVDFTKPSLAFVTPTDPDNTTVNIRRNFTLVNVTVSGNSTAIHTVMVNWNGTNQTLVQNGTGFYSINKTDLVEGNYTYFGWANDTLGNQNSTENRVFVVDITPPTPTYIPITDPDNRTANIKRNYTFINISIEEPYIHTVILNFNGTNQTLTRNGSNIFSVNKTNLAEGNYTYFVWVNDTVGNTNSTPNRIFVVDYRMPTALFVDPTYPDSKTVNFRRNYSFVNFTVTGNTTPLHTVLIDWNGTNQSLTLNGTNWYSINMTNLSEGNHTYYAWVNDSAGNPDTTDIRVLIVDNTPPVPAFVTPSDPDNFTAGLNRNSTFINVSINEQYVDTVILNFNGTNQTLTVNGTNIFSVNKMNLEEGNYTYFIWVNDTAGNINSTPNRALVVSFTRPNLDYVTPTDTDNRTFNYRRNYTYVNVTISGNVTALHTVLINWNGTNETLVQNGTGFYSINKTDLAEGNYTYFVYANDTGANQNSTPNRVLVIDNTPPFINFTAWSLANNSFSSNWTFLNISFRELYNDSFIISWNGTNYTKSSFTVITTNGRFRAFYRNFTSLNDGNYTYYAWANDTAGNTNETETRQITIDNTAPVMQAITASSNISGRMSIYSNSSTSALIYFNAINGEGDGQNITLYASHSEVYRANLTGNLTFSESPISTAEAAQMQISYTIEVNSTNASTLVRAFDKARNYGSITVSWANDSVDPVTIDDSAHDIANTWYTNDTLITINSTDVHSGFNRTYWCVYTAGATECSPNAMSFNRTNFVPLNCSDDSSCQWVIKYYSVDNVSNNESGGANGGRFRESKTIHIVKGSNVNSSLVNNSNISMGSYVRDSNISNSTIASCDIQNSRIVRSTIGRNSTHRYNCTIHSSTILDTNVTSAVIRNSFIDPSIVVDSVIENSNVTNAQVYYSRIENTTFCISGLYAYEAIIRNDTLVSGLIKYNETYYYGPYQLAGICALLKPTSVGVMSASPSIVNNTGIITFTYTTAGIGYNASINKSEFQEKLHNSTTSDLILRDNGDLPDTVQGDGIYKANFTMTPNNNMSDGQKTLVAYIDDLMGNKWNLNITITLDNTIPNASIRIQGTNSTATTSSRSVTLVLTYNDSVGISSCRYANEDLLFSDFEACSGTKAWALSSGDGTKAVWLEVRDHAGNVNRTNATISLNVSGTSVDTTAPSTPTVTDDGLYTNTKHMLHARWNSTDHEDEVQHVPLQYEYRISYNNSNNFVNGSAYLSVSTATEIRVYGLSLDNNTNYTFEVRAINNAGLRSSAGKSDGIIVDITPPETPWITSTHTANWSMENSIMFNFSSNDTISGIKSFSYLLDTNSTTTPDNADESETEHIQITGPKNTGQQQALKYNATGNASGIYIEVKQNLTVLDTLRITLYAAESHVETEDIYRLHIYAFTNSSPIAYNMTSGNVTTIANITFDPKYSTLINAESITADITSSTNITAGSFFVAIEAAPYDDDNNYNLLVPGSNTSMDNTTQAIYCPETGTCTDMSASFDYAVSVARNDLRGDNVWDKSYTVGNGRYYFHVKALDNSGNWGETAMFNISIDRSAPSTPQIAEPVKTTSNSSIVFEWTQSTDAESGVDNYYLEVDNDSDFSSIESASGWVGNRTNQTLTVTNISSTFHARVRSKNLAGVNSSLSSSVSTILDTTPPIITYLRPNGTIAIGQTTLAVKTNELSRCTYSVGSGESMNFRFTNSTYHETSISLSSGATSTVTVTCSDSVNNARQATATATVPSSQPSVSTVTLVPTSKNAFTDETTSIDVIVATSGTRLGAISTYNFGLYIDTSLQDTSITDNGQGNYTIAFIAPKTNGTRNMTAIVSGIASDQGTLTVSNLVFSVQFINSTLSPVSRQKMTYAVIGNNFTVGIASQSKSVSTASASSIGLNLTANAKDSDILVFVTKSTPGVERIESLLRDGTFMDAVSPSFGYAVKDDVFVVFTELEYDSIALSSNKTLSTGRHNLIIENKGYDSAINKTKLEVRIT
ncbi:hypothetical protein HYU11_03670 [Candidatus Woesearchaeota archaeon]|nr:hypothetical protein [Candidatus Woesearchaeota archaeon]